MINEQQTFFNIVFNRCSFPSCNYKSKELLQNYAYAIEEEFIDINSKPAVRLIIELEMAGSLVKEAVYIVRGDNKAWVITCATGQADFDTRYPTFEKMANSFEIQS